MSEKDKKIEINERLITDLTNLVLVLQKQVKNLHEDTLVNAQHLASFLDKQKNNLVKINNVLNDHVGETADMIENIVAEHEDKKSGNYIQFLNGLLKDDFFKKQNEVIEKAQREALGKVAKNNIGNYLSLIISISSASFLLFICYKFNILSQIF